MPRFFYHIRLGDRWTQDFEGTELDDVERACSEAVVTLSEIAREEFPRDGSHQNIAIHVFDEGGECVLAAAISFNAERPVDRGRNPDAGAGEDR